MKSAAKPQLFILKPVSEYGYRLVLDVYPAHPIDPLMALLEQPLRQLNAGLAAQFGRQERRVAWEEIDHQARSQCEQLSEALQDWAQGLEAQSAAEGVTQCVARARSLRRDMRAVMETPTRAEDDEGEGDGASAVAGTSALAGAGARSVGLNARGFTLSVLPYDISARFRALVDQHPSAWIFTSATLALAGDFKHFATRLGLADAPTLCLDSPFDYDTQAVLYLPSGLPEPSAPNYTEAVLEQVRPLLNASDGGAFLLFTSHRALRIAAAALRSAAWFTDWPLLVQNDAPREQLLRRFRESGRAVLLGAASFWEGVDVQGSALRLVVIDKLPFAPPDDPQVRARTQYLQSQGINAFKDYQLPEAALALKQGVGRLIRSEHDTGVVMICDPRLLSRGYGRALLASLPPLRTTREASEAIAMLRRSAPKLAATAQA